MKDLYIERGEANNISENLINKGLRKDSSLKAIINGIKREVTYVPLLKQNTVSLDNLVFDIRYKDLLAIFTKNNSDYDNGMAANFTAKMMVLENKSIDINNISKLLKYLNIDTLNIFSINLSDQKFHETLEVNNGSLVRLIEIDVFSFIECYSKSTGFKSWNGSSLYILRDGTYKDLKYIFSQMENAINLGRGGSQKSHILSPLDIRLSFYLIALQYTLDFKEITKLNTFKNLEKNKYLPYE